MRRLGLLLTIVLATPAAAGEIGDQLAQRLYDGTQAEVRDRADVLCNQSEGDACFAMGMAELIGAYQGLSQAFYRHGAVDATGPGLAILWGFGDSPSLAVPANPDPQPLTYAGLRDILQVFSDDLGSASSYFEMADTEDGDFAIHIDPLKVRLDLDGDGEIGAGETLSAVLGDISEFAALPYPDGLPPSGKTKSKPAGMQDTTIGFDKADAIWLAGYTTAARAPVELILAHDFEAFFTAYMHRIFPSAGLPMSDYALPDGTLFMGGEGDTAIADVIAGIHTMRFPVTDSARLADVLAQLQRVTTLSRRNWELILAETDDDRELLPSPSQTSIVPGMSVTQDSVDAWMATLDTVDAVLAGKLLVPHWRFKTGGVDLKAYFETATETDVVMLFTGQAALPFLKDGPVADAQSFAAANETFGTDWLNYALWFN